MATFNFHPRVGITAIVFAVSFGAAVYTAGPLFETRMEFPAGVDPYSLAAHDP